MPRLSEEQRNNAIGRLQAGQSQTDVANTFNVAQSTISRLWDRYQRYRLTRDLPRTGRPRVTSNAQDRYIRLRHMRERFTTATSTASSIPGNRRISDQTVRNRLREAGLRARRPLRAVVLNNVHRQNRLQWAHEHRVWSQHQWRKVWFSDESRFLLQRADGRARVYRRNNERFARNCIQEVDSFGGGSVMVWAAISHTGRSTLVLINGSLTALRYRDEILQEHVLPIMQNNDLIFQHDNARPHTARLTISFLRDNNVSVLPWPSKSPDLNPIEHLWDELDRRVRARQPAPQSLRQLAVALQEEWVNIPQEVIRNLILSMGRRCQAVINARGGHTRY